MPVQSSISTSATDPVPSSPGMKEVSEISSTSIVYGSPSRISASSRAWSRPSAAPATSSHTVLSSQQLPPPHGPASPAGPVDLPGTLATYPPAGAGHEVEPGQRYDCSKPSGSSSAAGRAAAARSTVTTSGASVGLAAGPPGAQAA